MPAEPSSALPNFLSSTIHEALASEKLDRCIALQSRTSGVLHAQSSALKDLNIQTERELANLKKEFADGIKLAKGIHADLKDIQRRIEACEQLAKKKFPVEYHNSRDRLTGGFVMDD